MLNNPLIKSLHLFCWPGKSRASCCHQSESVETMSKRSQRCDNDRQEAEVVDTVAQVCKRNDAKCTTVFKGVNISNLLEQLSMLYCIKYLQCHVFNIVKPLYL